jgi:4-hydroxyphenylpyruvate dioxygenase-like putative hemolysin
MERVRGLHHVAWCVKPENMDRARAYWEEAIGLDRMEDLDLADLGIRVLVSWEGGVEIMCPTNEDGSMAVAVRKFLDERGEGVYSVVYNVSDIAATRAKIVAEGGQLVFEELIPAEAVDDRQLASEPAKERFSIKQALYEDICGMRVCLQEITPE